jgi:hypothetical protein
MVKRVVMMIMMSPDSNGDKELIASQLEIPLMTIAAMIK